MDINEGIPTLSKSDTQLDSQNKDFETRTKELREQNVEREEEKKLKESKKTSRRKL